MQWVAMLNAKREVGCSTHAKFNYSGVSKGKLDLIEGAEYTISVSSASREDEYGEEGDLLSFLPFGSSTKTSSLQKNISKGMLGEPTVRHSAMGTLLPRTHTIVARKSGIHFLGISDFNR